MAFIPTPSVVKMDIIQSEFGQTIVNTLWIKVALPIVIALLTDLSDAVRAWFITELLPNFSSQLTGTTTRATDQSSSSGASVLKVHGNNTGGESEGTGNPSGVALAVKFATDKRGRSYRGRVYLAGIPTDRQVSGDANTVDSTLISEIVTKFGLLVPNYLVPVDPAAQHVVVSHFANKAPRAAGVATVVSAYQVNNRIDSQRRRLTGRGQ